METVPDTKQQPAEIRIDALSQEMDVSEEIPYMDEERSPSPTSSRTGTLKARKNSKGRSPKCSPMMVNKESSIPIVKKEAEKVMEMFLKRRSMSMNDAILQKEFFSQERKRRKDRAPRNNTTSICSTMSTDSSDYRNSGEYEETTLQRSKGSFSRALENSVLPGDVKREQSSADDELSSSDHEMEKEKPRSAPSTLRMQIGPVTESDLEKLKLAGNGITQHEKDGVKKDPKKRDIPKRRKSLLDKAKQIIRSPSMQRKHDHSEEKEAPAAAEETSSSRSKVHQEMKQSGFANRLRRTFKRDGRKTSLKSNDAETRTPTPLHSADSREGPKTRRWPSFQFRRRPRNKSASTPTDDSLAGATPSDTTSNADWQSISDYDHTQSLTDLERRKLLREIHNGVQLRQIPPAAGSDSQLHPRKPRRSSAGRSPSGPDPNTLGSTGTQTPSSLLSSSQESGMSSDWSSGGSGQKSQRPRSLNLTRSKRQERAKQGFNDVLKLDRITPGHVRRDTDTRRPVMPTATQGANGDGEDLVADGVEDGDNMSVEGDGDATLQRPSKKEREEFYKQIADRLAQIGDRFVTEYQDGVVGPAAPADGDAPPPEKAKEPSATVAVTEMRGTGATGGTESEERLFEAIGGRIRDHVDGYRALHNQRLHPFSLQSILSVVRDHTYAVFRDTMQSLIGQNTGFEQLALVFKFTKLAMKIAQHYGARAVDIKENSLRYIGDRFAAWLDSQGGWAAIMDSCDSDEEGDQSHHTESEID